MTPVHRQSHLHSVSLDADACRGCTNCLKRCPTEAIRVRNHKAVITETRCVDCGECIRHCPWRAKKAMVDTLAALERYRWRIAIPAPSFHGQFDGRHSISDIHRALQACGFHQVVDVALAARMAADATRDWLASSPSVHPVISSSCPAVLRMIMVRFPALIDNLAPVLAPMEICARSIRKVLASPGGLVTGNIRSPSGLRPGDAGIFFLSPCAGKMTDLWDPVGTDASSVDGVIGFKDMYLPVRNALSALNGAENGPPRKGTMPPDASSDGLAWGRGDGEGASVGTDNRVSVDGIEHVIQILEMAENGSLEGVEFIEAMACPAGCVGGPLAVENPFVARVRLMNREKTETVPPAGLVPLSPREMRWRGRPEPRKSYLLADSLEEALRREELMESLAASLPGLDCGTCGAPSCRALAEDVACGRASLDDCLMRNRE